MPRSPVPRVLWSIAALLHVDQMLALLGGLVALPWAVKLSALALSEPATPYVGQALLLPVATLASYLGHRHFSFAAGERGIR